jgi:hypothetical protein
MVEFRRLLVVALLAASWSTGAGADAAIARPPGWAPLPLPGNRVQLCRAAGLDERTDAARLPFELVRILYGTPAGAPPASARTHAAILDYLRMPPAEGAGRELVPSPLTPDAWREVAFKGQSVDDGQLLSAILSNRSTALLYYGLAALDAETLDFVRSRPRLIAWLAAERPATLAVCGGSLRVANGAVQLPGGNSAETAWRSLVGQSPAEADRFIRALLQRDQGRLAYFYDTLASLDAPHRRFALGPPVSSPAYQAGRFQALYAAFAGVDPAWSLEGGPFTRRVDDGRLLLSTVRVDSDGVLAPPAAVGFWKTVYEGVRAGADDTRADAAAMAQLVLDREWRVRRQRMRALLFAQRLFGGAPAGQAAAATRSYQRFETLHLTLERIGIVDPAIQARAGERAADLETLKFAPGAPNARQRAALLSQFQGALAVVDRCAFRGTLDMRARRALVESLIAVQTSEFGYEGRVASWISASLVPELRAALKGSSAESVEDLLLEALAGLVPPGSAALPTVRWEEHDYRIDESSGELSRLLLVRQRQGGNRLDDVLALEDQAARLRQGAGADASRLAVLARTLRAPALRSVADRPDDASVERLLLGASREVAAGKPPTAARVGQAADETLGDVLRALAYAAHIGDPENNILLGPSLADDHDFGLDEPRAEPLDTAWSMPFERMGGGAAWHVTGSLLCLDAILGRYALPRPTAPPPGPRRVSRRDEQAFAHAAVLTRAADLSDADRDVLVARIANGRERASVSDPGAALDVGAAAGLDARRQNQLAWMAAHGRLPASDLTLADLARIGTAAGAPPVAQSWGAPSVGFDGCPCLRLPAGPPLDGYGWLPSAAVGAAALPDLVLRLAEITAKLRLPAALVALLLPDATQELLQQAQPAYSDDWTGLALAARDLGEERRGEMVAGFTAAGGPLVPLGARVKHE